MVNGVRYTSNGPGHRIKVPKSNDIAHMVSLFEREEKKSNEVDLDIEQSGRVFLMLWAATEALDAAWRAPASPEWAQA